MTTQAGGDRGGFAGSRDLLTIVDVSPERASAHLRTLAQLPGHRGAAVLQPDPGGAVHPAAATWAASSFHWYADGSAADEAAAVAGADEPEAVTRWRRVSTHGHRGAVADPAWFVVLARPRPGLEDVYDDWYREHHQQDMLGIPGFVSCVRFRAAEAGRWSFLTVYEMDATDIRATVETEVRHIANPRITWTQAKDSSSTAVLIGRPRFELA